MTYRPRPGLPERNCAQCGNPFKPHDARGRFCSKICGGLFYNAKNRQSSGLGLPTATVDAISEIVAGADLLKRGYEVFRALSPSCSCDLIALLPGKAPLRIEVRTGYRSPVTGHLSFARNGTKKKLASGVRSYAPRRTEADLDHYCVVIGAGEEIVYVPPLSETLLGGATVAEDCLEERWRDATT